MKAKHLTLALLATASMGCYSAPAQAQAEPFIGQLMLTGANFCPRGWATASGQILSIASNTALFSLLGTTYGGNGQTTFALPDLRGRVPISNGQGPGLSPYSMGQAGGTENTTLNILQMPIHNHTATATTQIKVAGGVQADTPTPVRNSFAVTGTNNTYYTGDPTVHIMDAATAATTVTVNTNGGSQPFSTLQPYLTLQWCIALEGIFPSRN
ncbi:phage tail protein [Sphingomonas canadensis]|uniref:Phage tail protein n=1 Tax=Sphingomonas canadensis TaxID=1219257 RepID=A0ABW3HF77_9SPHN|nr:tail fiber protein [Sphingomonas canadensis]MCW3837666.1 tail fiber protein [Sphingomonas canadensis]